MPQGLASAHRCLQWVMAVSPLACSTLQWLTEKWGGFFLQSMDSHPEQIALRPKEFFRTYDIEVLTEMQVRTVPCVPAVCLCKRWLAEAVVREWDSSWLTGCCCRNVGSPPAPVPCPGAQIACGCSKPPLFSLMTIISYLPFTSIPMRLRGGQLASDEGHRPVSSAGSEG